MAAFSSPLMKGIVLPKNKVKIPLRSLMSSKMKAPKIGGFGTKPAVGYVPKPLA